MKLHIMGMLLALLLIGCGRTVPPEPTPTPRRPAPVVATGTPTASLPSPTPTKTLSFTARYFSGQTFLTWPERTDLNGEVYRIYRSNKPINAGSLDQAQLLAKVGKNSARVWASYYVDQGAWAARLTDRFVLQDNAAPLEPGMGALVWTLAAEDFGGHTSGLGYYAVTVTPPGGTESLPHWASTGPVEEAVGDPAPVEVSGSPGIHPGPGGLFYLQYMDLRHWNATFHAPNRTNQFYGMDPADPNLTNALAYTYDYSIFTPTPDLCGGKIPEKLPVMMFLHGARENRYNPPQDYIYPYCAYGLYPIDQSETWYFGFAQRHDYRTNTPIEVGDVIENFTEQRILRMIYDLMRNPPGPLVDQQRVYVFGHSMGGTGTLAFAERYPNLFAAAYSGQPVTNFRPTAGVEEPWPGLAAERWGAQSLNLPIAIRAPGDWAAHLQGYNGLGVFDWETLTAAFDPQAVPDRSGDEMVPFSIDHGTIDEDVKFPSQGQPLYPLLEASPRTWGGVITHTAHEWSDFGWPLPNLGKVDKVPFWNLSAIRDETVPGLSHVSGNGKTYFNQTVLWSASWNAWDGAPVDEPGTWQMSFCAIKVGAQKCGSGEAQTASITPRRVQYFVITPGKEYTWTNTRISDGKVVAKGTVTADDNGVLTVKDVMITPGGNRVGIKTD